jgi:hypothetical protein
MKRMWDVMVGFLVGVACVVVALCAGCMVIRTPTPLGDATIHSFLKVVDMPKLSITSSNATNSVTMTIEGYASRGDTEMVTVSAGAIGAIVGAAVKTAVK